MANIRIEKMSPHANPFIARTSRVFPPQGRYGLLRHDMNENPEGLPKDFVDAVLKEITPEFLAIYPEPDRFLAKYAAFVGVDFGNVMCTNGSDMAIRYLLETFGEVGKEVVTVAPSFEMYRVNCSILGYRHVPVAYEPDLSVRIDRIVAAISDETRVVVLLNPNNPIGNVYSDDEFAAVLRRAEEVGALVIVDEAYHYFCSKTFLRQALASPNAVVLRTFSKLMSLAACRLGVIIGCAELIRTVRNARLTFDANAVALLFAERLLERSDIVRQLIADQQDGKDWCLAELRARGYRCRDCAGNFIFVRPRGDAHALAARLASERHVLVHTFGNPLLRDFIRVSTGSRSAMRRFLAAFLAADT